MPKTTDEELRTTAVRLHYDEGNVEIDPNAEVSHGGEEGEEGAGAYVRAWVWVPYDAVTDEDRKNAHPDRCEPKLRAIVMVGTLGDGFVAVGPFDSLEDALRSDAAKEPDAEAMLLREPKNVEG